MCGPFFLGLNMQTVFPPSDLYNWVSRIYEPGSRLLLTDYGFPVDFGDVAIGATLTRQVQMQQNADFVLCSIDPYFGESAGTPYNTYFTLVDTTTGEQLSNEFTPFLPVIIGPFGVVNRSLPYPRWFAGISALSMSVRPAISALTNFSLTLRGFKIQRLS